MFFDRGDHYLVDVGARKGKALINEDFTDSGVQLKPEDKKDWDSKAEQERLFQDCSIIRTGKKELTNV